MKKINNAVILMFVILATVINCKAQDQDRAMLRKVIKENQDAVNAIALYPTETRKIIFEASEYPEVISRLNAMQKNTQDTFEKLIAPLSKDEQEKIWNLTRYDNLISDLAADHKKSADEMNALLANYPDEIHATAIDEGTNNYDLLVQIDKMNKSYNSDFETLISTYPPEAINAFREIIKLPEVLQILFDHMQYTVVIGDYYKKNPDRVIHKTDSLNLVLTQKNAQDATDWKQSITDDPQSQQEYTQAAQDYAQQNGYQPADYQAPLTPDVTNYNSPPYNWWFGYPSWYPYNYWNPYPYWYDWGFYYGPGGQAVFFGMPSAYFMNWYFYNPANSYRYPELSNHYYNYYSAHRASMNYNPISYSVNAWRNNNRALISDDWDKNSAARVQGFKEYGQMEMSRNKYNAAHPQQQISQADYIQQRQTKYPTLSANVSKNQLNHNITKTKSFQGTITEPYKKPTVEVPQRYKVTSNQQSPNGNRQQQPAYRNPQQGNLNQARQSQNENQIRTAQQYHQNSWQQIQPQAQPQRQEQNTAPAREEQSPREQPARESAPSSPGRR